MLWKSARGQGNLFYACFTTGRSQGKFSELIFEERQLILGSLLFCVHRGFEPAGSTS